MALGLLLLSLPGPWLTLAFPPAAAFALHDRRTGARIVATLVVAAVAATTVSTGFGAGLFAAAALAIGGAAWTLGRRPVEMGAMAGPTLVPAATGLGATALIVPDAVAEWEGALGRGVAESGAAAIQRYRDLGLDPATVESLETVSGATAAWAVRLWPALVLVTLWLGTWLGYRLLIRWGRVAVPPTGKGFERFRLGEPAIWFLIAGLVGVWAPEPGRRLAVNLLAVVGTLYAFQGLAVTIWAISRRGIGRWIRLAVGGLLFLFVPPVLVGGALALGLADHWVDWRGTAEVGRSTAGEG